MRYPTPVPLRFRGQAVGRRSSCARLSKLAYAPCLLDGGNRHWGQGNPSPTLGLLREARGRHGAPDQAMYGPTPSEAVDDVAGPPGKARSARERLRIRCLAAVVRGTDLFPYLSV